LAEGLYKHMLVVRVSIQLLMIVSWTSHAAMTEPFDGRWQLGDQHSVVTELQPTAGKAGYVERLFGGNSFSVQYLFRSHQWYADARYSRTDDVFRAGYKSGRKIGNNGSEFAVGRSWSGSGWWKRQSLRTTYQFSKNNDGQVLTDRFITRLNIAGPNESAVQLQYHNGREFQKGRLVDFDRVALTGTISPHDSLEMGIKTQIGDRVDLASTGLAEQRQVQQFLRWTVNEQLALHLDNINVGLASRAGQAILDASIVNAHLIWQFDDKGSVRLSMRQRDIERNPDAYAESVEGHSKDVGSEVRYSWKPNPQTVFDLGYSDAYDKKTNFGPSGSANHNWFMQVGYTLAF